MMENNFHIDQITKIWQRFYVAVWVSDYVIYTFWNTPHPHCCRCLAGFHDNATTPNACQPWENRNVDGPCMLHMCSWHSVGHFSSRLLCHIVFGAVCWKAVFEKLESLTKGMFLQQLTIGFTVNGKLEQQVAWSWHAVLCTSWPCCLSVSV